MAPRLDTPTKRVAAKAARGVTWMSILAATTLGVSGIDQVRARISGKAGITSEGELRLIVQSYDRSALRSGELPKSTSQPRASIQRAITAEELRDGVDVSLVQLPDGETHDDAVIVAWVERGSATLDFDGMEARPGTGAYCGVGESTAGEIALQLTQS